MMRIFFFLLIIDFYKSTSTDFFSIHKNNLETNISKYKLDNYLKKIKMKAEKIFEKFQENNFLFFNSEVELLALKNLKPENINYEKIKKTEDFNEFKARVYAYVYQNYNNEKNDIIKYETLGLNEDEEKSPEWDIFLALLSSNSIKKHKLLKICVPKKNPQITFAIIQSFDQNCTDIINELNAKSILKDEKNIQTEKLHQIQSQILNNNFKDQISKNLNYNYNNIDYSNSFLEKSTEETTRKGYSIDSLAEKFSVEELERIKSLIKFAKENNVLDQIHSKKGDVKIYELLPSNNITYYNNISEISKLNSEISFLKNSLVSQKNEFEKYYKEINNKMKNIVYGLNKNNHDISIDNIVAKNKDDDKNKAMDNQIKNIKKEKKIKNFADKKKEPEISNLSPFFSQFSNTEDEEDDASDKKAKISNENENSNINDDDYDFISP